MNNYKIIFSRIGFNYLILAITTLILQIIVFNILSITNPSFLDNITIKSTIAAICSYILPFIIFYWLMKRLKSTEIEKESINLKTFLIYIGITMTLIWIGNMIGSILTALLGSAIHNNISNPVNQLINSTDLWFNFIIICVIAPIFEEIVFRKLLIDRTIQFGARVSIILSAVLFGLYHGNLNQFCYAFLLGGFLGYVYVKTGKIHYTIILHAITNFIGSIVVLFFAKSVAALQTGASLIDSIIVLSYAAFMLLFIILGVYGLSKFKKAKFNGSKTEINLKYPFNTMFVNYGMLFFIAYFIIHITMQIFQ